MMLVPRLLVIPTTEYLLVLVLYLCIFGNMRYLVDLLALQVQMLQREVNFINALLKVIVVDQSLLLLVKVSVNEGLRCVTTDGLVSVSI